MKRRVVKSKGEKERCKHLNAEFQRIARRDKKVFLSDRCKEIEENNRIGKTRMSMGFSRQEYWRALPFPSPGDLPDPGIELGSPALQADSLPSEPPRKPLYSYGLYNSL